MILSRVTSPTASWVSVLRQDGEEIAIVEMSDCNLGERMLFVVDLHLPGRILTLRPTSPVISIEKVDFNELGSGQAR
jgi:hypothetical protein